MEEAMSDGTQTALFDLTLTDEQQLTRETMQRFAASEIAPLARRVDESGAVPDAFLDGSAGLGVASVVLPEEYGGAGLERSPVSNVLIAEDLARGDMGLALAALAPLGVANLLLDQGSASQKDDWLPRFAEESFHAATVALAEPRPGFDAGSLATRARRDGAGFVLEGTKSLVPLARRAELTVVIADLEGEGPRGFLVPAGSEGVSVEAERYMGLRGLEPGRVVLDGCRLPASALLGEGEPFDYARLLDLCRLGLSAAAVGTCQAVLEYTRDYANERKAFGEPISHKQAVAFMIADIAIELDGMRLLTWRAASRAEQGLDFHREAFLAWVQCTRKAMEIGTNGVQLLGGHGFTQEHPVELWYRNLRGAAMLEGCFCV